MFRSEKIYHVEAPKTYTDDISTLVNYQGKLGFVYCKKDMEIWVMKDAEKETHKDGPGFSFTRCMAFQIGASWVLLVVVRSFLAS